jgi:hypothetical protein
MNTDHPQSESFGLPFNQDMAFSNPKGTFKERIKKKQLRMVEQYAPLLKQFLEPGEEILLVMRGCSPVSMMEQLTTGWIIFLLKRCTLVVTNRRILHFPSKTNFTPRNSVAQIRYGDVGVIKPSTWMGRKFTVKYKNGSKETFLYVKESRKLKAVLSTLQIQGQPETLLRVRHHLCPKCTAPLNPGIYSCAKCGLEFKSERKARALSIFLPGGGYFYTGHHFLGIGDAVVEGALLVVVITSLADILFGAVDPLEKMKLLVIFGVLLVYEKLISIYHARHYVKEYIPLEKDFQPMRQG